MKYNKIALLGTIIFLLSFLFTIQANAKQNSDSLTLDENLIKPIYEDNLDSLLNLWYIKHSAPVEDLVNDTTKNLNTPFLYVPDSVYSERLSRIPNMFKLTYNPIVRSYIEMYTQRKRELVQVMLGMSEFYFPKFDDIFDYYGVPNELKYMSIIESALNPRARSRTRAIGIWQFMYGTGKLYGLNVNSLVDERRDPIAETHAAAKYVKDLYKIYGDWQLVVAAYNCGPGNVNKAIRRSGGKRNYWDIYRFLPRETRGHVPAFIAAAYTMNYYKEHNLVPTRVNMPRNTDTIMVSTELHLMQVADVLKISIEQLRDLNPQYLYDIIPARGISYPLTLPVEYTTKFIDLQDTIFAYKKAIYFDPNELSKTPNFNSYKVIHTKPSGNMSAVYYTVQTGDNLGSISMVYGCSINSILEWNNLWSNKIRAGQKLLLYVPKKSVANQSAKTTKSTNNKSTVQNTSLVNSQNAKFVYYTVKQGDTIWDITKQYPGITEEDIRSWNNLGGNNIIPGQQLKIKVM
jgi:membrane-bound lytic murein transglycosylase D